MTDVRTDIAATITADFATLAQTIADACPAPAGHRWESPASELLWWQGDVIDSTRHGASIFLRCVDPALSEEVRYHVEVRWFPRAVDLSGVRIRERQEAMLWCTRGPRRGGFHNLLDAPEIFPKADTVEALGAIAATTLRRILWR